MKRLMLAGCAATAITVALADFSPARADFYSLDGRFQCLDHANTICGDARPLVSLTPPAVTVQPVPEAGPAQLAPPVAEKQAPLAPVEDPLRAIARRVQSAAPTADDIFWLRQQAHEQNPRAVELLAWCSLHGIGMATDPVAAYVLYGMAANAGVPHARDNQAVVYEEELSSDQRQQLLNLTYNNIAATGPDIALTR